MESIIKKIIWGCLLAVPFLALHVANGRVTDPLSWFGIEQLFFPFISGKNLLFRVLVEVALAGWAVLALSDKRYRISFKKSPIMIAYALFITVLFFANIFGVDPEKSFWSNFERMEGFVGHIHLFAYFFVLTVMVRTQEEWSKMWKFFIAGNVLVLMYGFFQFLGVKDLWFGKLFPSISALFAQNFPVSQGAIRIDATIGNPAYFGVFCLMYVFITGLIWIEKRGTQYAWMYMALLIANILGVFYSGTRGSILGLVAGGIVMLAMLAWKEKGKMRNLFVKVIVSTVVVATLLVTFKDTALVRSSPTLYRLASISLNDLTTASRFSIWGISYEAWKEKPILGYGQDNFSHVFARKFIPDQMCNLEPWYDRSHNVFFDWLIAAGILGLLTYLSLYVVTLWFMWRKESPMSILEKSIITGALAGYFVHNIFVFDNLTSYILFFALLAYVTVRTGGVASHGNPIMGNDTLKYLAAPIIGIALLVVLYYVNYRPIVVNGLVIDAMSISRYMQTMPFADAIKRQQSGFEEAIKMNTLGSIEAREQFLQMIPRMAQIQIPESMPQGDRQAAIAAMNGLVSAGKQDVIDSFEKNKEDVRMLSLYGLFLNGVGEGAAAEQVLQEAYKIAPNKQLTTNDLIRAKLLQQKYKEAAELAKITYDKGINCQNAQKWLLVSAAYAGMYKEAREYAESKGQSVVADYDVITGLVMTNQKPLAIELLNEIKKQNPAKASEIDAIIKQVIQTPVAPAR
ncbi:MAG: hypothetical protein RI935_607 [Candidatus Parcubacteria bacterium]|jgi:O-antigen ligase